VEETRQFLADTECGQRTALIEKLTDRPEFAGNVGNEMGRIASDSLSQNPFFSYKNALAYYNWLHDQIQANVPMDRMVKELLTASGGTFKNPAANYYKVET
jgi:hypothetical protein